MLNWILLIASLVLTAGCASIGADKSTLVAADFGSYPDDYKEAVREYFNVTLKDPESARIRFIEEPIKGYVRNAPVAGGRPKLYGYVVAVGINAKNSFGGYVGERRYRLLIRNGSVRELIHPNPYFKEAWYQ